MIKGMDTIAQFKIMQFIQENFYEDSITIKKIDDTALEVTDRTGNSIVFEYSDNKVKERG